MSERAFWKTRDCFITHSFHSAQIRFDYGIADEIANAKVEEESEEAEVQEAGQDNLMTEAEKIERDVTRKTGITTSEWLENVDKDGKKYWINQATDEYKYEE